MCKEGHSRGHLCGRERHGRVGLGRRDCCSLVIREIDIVERFLQHRPILSIIASV